jgi:hypothetical protein
MANQNNYGLQDYGLYQVIGTPFNPNLNNTLNLATLKEFSDSTKFSFIQNIVECKGFDEIIKDSGKQNLNYADSFMFVYGTNDENRGVFALMNPKESFLFKLFGLEQIDIVPSSALSIQCVFAKKQLGLKKRRQGVNMSVFEIIFSQ